MTETTINLVLTGVVGVLSWMTNRKVRACGDRKCQDKVVQISTKVIQDQDRKNVDLAHDAISDG